MENLEAIGGFLGCSMASHACESIKPTVYVPTISKLKASAFNKHLKTCMHMRTVMVCGEGGILRESGERTVAGLGQLPVLPHGRAANTDAQAALHASTQAAFTPLNDEQRASWTAASMQFMQFRLCVLAKGTGK